MMTEAVWDLRYLLDGLRFAARKPSDGDKAYSSLGEFAFAGLVDNDMDAQVWYLTPAGTALLALLEVEHCKRRVIAAGWAWSENTNGGNADCPLAVYDLRDRVYSWHAIEPLGDTVTVEHARAAAQYAEAHAQGVQE